jgi:hypothetical protein
VIDLTGECSCSHVPIPQTIYQTNPRHVSDDHPDHALDNDKPIIDLTQHDNNNDHNAAAERARSAATGSAQAPAPTPAELRGMSFAQALPIVARLATDGAFVRAVAEVRSLVLPTQMPAQLSLICNKSHINR